MSQIYRSLLPWFHKHKRDLPWRHTHDPYAIWVSEIMLQQTQVSTVIPYYKRWMETFPNIHSLALADEQNALSLWQGLGYYRRCRMLLAGAKWVHEHGMPQNAKNWQQVPGVGPYTAGAIASIAYQEPTPLVDGNVERVFARLTGSEKTGNNLHKAAWEWAHQVLNKDQPGNWNQALMELGATICTPQNPLCNKCPLEKVCIAKQTNRTQELPAPKPRKSPILLQHTVWIPHHQGKFGIRQIPKNEWWENMWEFPRTNTVGTEAENTLRVIVGEGWLQTIGSLTHTVTHHKIKLEIFLINTNTPSPHLHWHTPQELLTIPMPAPQRKAFHLAKEHL